MTVWGITSKTTTSIECCCRLEQQVNAEKLESHTNHGGSIQTPQRTTRESACSLQHSLVLHLHPCPPSKTLMVRIWKQHKGLVSFSASYKPLARYIPLLCKTSAYNTLTCRRGRRLQPASPSLALSAGSFCSNGLANQREKWRYGPAPSNGSWWGKAKLAHEAVSKRRGGRCACFERFMAVVFDFLLAEHLMVRGLFIYLD
jgi:hypothetical protein